MTEATFVNVFLKRIADALDKLVEIEEEKLRLYRNYREFIDSEEYKEEKIQKNIRRKKEMKSKEIIKQIEGSIYRFLDCSVCEDRIHIYKRIDQSNGTFYWKPYKHISKDKRDFENLEKFCDEYEAKQSPNSMD